MAIFPTAIVTTSTLLTVAPGAPRNNPSHVGQHDNLNGEVIAIETALGTNPQGSYATVSAALTTQGTLITAAQTTANTAVTLATAAQTTATTALTTATAAQSTATSALTAATAAQTTATAAQTTANSRATYPGAGVPVSTGSAWGTSNTGTSGQVAVWGSSNSQSGAASNSVGGMVNLQSGSTTAGTTFTISGLSPNVRYKLFLNLVQNGTAGAPNITCNADTAANYTYAIVINSPTTAGAASVYGVAGANYIALSPPNRAVGVSYPLWGELSFTTWNSTSGSVSFNYQNITYDASDSYYITNVGGGVYVGSSSLSSLTFKTSAGSVSGTWALYQYA